LVPTSEPAQTKLKRLVAREEVAFSGGRVQALTRAAEYDRWVNNNVQSSRDDQDAIEAWVVKDNPLHRDRADRGACGKAVSEEHLKASVFMAKTACSPLQICVGRYVFDSNRCNAACMNFCAGLPVIRFSNWVLTRCTSPPVTGVVPARIAAIKVHSVV